MLGAVAKRTLQMTRGIETFSAIEMRLDEGLENQLLQREMLAANEIAMAELNEMLDGLPGEVTGATANALTQTQQALAAQLQQLQEENKTLGQELSRLQKALEVQATEVSALRSVRSELSTCVPVCNRWKQPLAIFTSSSARELPNRFWVPEEEVLIQ